MKKQKQKMNKATIEIQYQKLIKLRIQLPSLKKLISL